MFLKKYFLKLFSSINSIGFYRDLQNSSLLSVILFFLFSFFYLGVWFSIGIILKDIPELENQLEQELNLIKENYPDDLVITWDQEKLIINREKINLNYPDWFEFNKENFPKYFVSYTQLNLTSELISQKLENSSLFIFDNDKIFVSNLKGKYSSLPLKETPGFEAKFIIDKNSLPGKINLFQEKLKSVFKSFKIILPIFLIPGFIILGLLGNLIDTLLVFLFIRIFYIFNFKYIFKISLHIAVIAQLIERLSSSLYKNYHYPLFAISYWVIMIFVLWNLNLNGRD